VNLRLGYERDQGADQPFVGVTIALPIFARGQEEQVAGLARVQRLRLELEAAKRALEVEVRAAFEAHRLKVEAAQALRTTVLPSLDGNEALARRGYEVGEMSLPEVLLVRRESLSTRLDQVDRALAAATAAVELEERAGVLR
jgi:outer membrane protein TolC